MLQEWLASELRIQRRSVAEARLRATVWRDDDLVFPSSIGTPQDPHNLRRALKPHAERVGFPGSFHALRHWYSTEALEHVSIVQVAKALGHARTSTTTDLYGHQSDDAGERIAVAVTVAVNPAAVAPKHEEECARRDSNPQPTG